jgi:predicted permease
MVLATIITISVVWVLMLLLSSGWPGERRAIDSMAATMGNVGNLGFPIVLFAFGEAALPSAVIHFLAATVCIFGFGVTAGARLQSGSGATALRRVVTTPAILVVPLGFLMAATEWTLPTPPDRLIGLLADAMIPVMLLTLGMQLASSPFTTAFKRLGTIAVAKLVVSPLIFVGVAAAFGLSGFARDTGILLAAMPTAVLVGLIGIEFDLEAEVASAAILLTSLISLGTLSVLLALL